MLFMSKRWLGPVLILTLLALPVATATARDDDRLPDRWERRHGLSPSKPSGKRDPDGDRLRNRLEYELRTHPRKRDTDGDGLGDGGEVRRYRTNPRRRDTDRDGYSDGAEIRAGTKPRKRSSHPSGGSTPAPPSPGASPRPSNVGVPAGWAPAQTRSSDLVVTQAGAVVQDVLLTRGDIVVNAPNVTLRRVKLQGGRVINTQGSCKNGLVVEDSTFEPAPGQQYANDAEGMTGAGGYTARRVLIWRRQEGFRVGGKGDGCGPVSIEDSFAKISIPPGCPGDPHSDGIQGYGGPALSVRNVTIDFREASCGTAPFFVPHSQGNTSVDVNGLLVMGGGYSFRLGVPGAVRGLKIADGSWHYGPVDVRCSGVSPWDAQIVTVTEDYQVSSVRRSQACRGTGG
jgi:Bacterial TSP3 repeat